MGSSDTSGDRIDILIVEDEAITRMSLLQLLEGEGYVCAEADDGCEALEIALRCQPRLVLLDVMMPRLDGFAVARQLRSDPRTRDIRIHFLTARSDVDARRAARHSGAVGLLTKPFDFDGLLDAVSIAMSCGQKMPQRRSAKRLVDPDLNHHPTNSLPPSEFGSLDRLAR